MTGLNRTSNIATRTSRHALFWLFFANSVGMVMAILLLKPAWGTMLGPVGFGRLAPAHMNLQLYGWCSLPLIAMLLHFYGHQQNRPPSRVERSAPWGWSIALAAGTLSWLSGQTSAKLFLDWKGPALWTFVLACYLLWLALGTGWLAQVRTSGSWSTPRTAIGLAGLLALALVPALIILATNPNVYPAINPNSGGATGTSLMGSTLGIITLFILTPYLLGLARREQTGGSNFHRHLFLLMTACFFWFGLLPHGNITNSHMNQLAALAALGLWLPLLIKHYRRFLWPPHLNRWMTAFAAWGLLVWLDGLTAFAPGILQYWKFTNAMVAHAHIAMAGMVSAFLMLIMLQMGGPALHFLAQRPALILWQTGCATYAISMTALGWMEGYQPGILYSGCRWVSMAYTLRLVAGGAMWLASAHWAGHALFPAAMARLTRLFQRKPAAALSQLTPTGAPGRISCQPQ